MKPLTAIIRLLLGLAFSVFGLNGFLAFFPAPPMAGPAGAFIGAMAVSHYLFLVSGTQLVAGLLLLSNRFVPLALALLAPMLANILVFHVTMQPAGLPPGIVATVLWGFLAFRYRSYFASIFVARAQPVQG
jgi:putative oxidoreductase